MSDDRSPSVAFLPLLRMQKKKREQQQIWRSKHQLNHNSVCLFALQTPREVKLYNRNCLSLAFTTEDTESLYHFL